MNEEVTSDLLFVNRGKIWKDETGICGHKALPVDTQSQIKVEGQTKGLDGCLCGLVFISVNSQSGTAALVDIEYLAAD